MGFLNSLFGGSNSVKINDLSVVTNKDLYYYGDDIHGTIHFVSTQGDLLPVNSCSVTLKWKSRVISDWSWGLFNDLEFTMPSRSNSHEVSLIQNTTTQFSFVLPTQDYITKLSLEKYINLCIQNPDMELGFIPGEGNMKDLDQGFSEEINSITFYLEVKCGNQKSKHPIIFDNSERDIVIDNFKKGIYHK